MQHTRALAGVTTLAIALGAMAAPAAAQSPSAAAGGGEKCTGQKVTFLLSFVPNVQHAGFLTAAARGFYAEEGLDVEVQPGSPGTDVTQAVGDGSVNLGQIDYVDIVEARLAGVPIKAVAQTYKLPFFFWFTNKDSGIATIEDWKGHSVGMIQPGDYPERDAALLGAGLDPETDVTYVQQDFGTDDFMAGKVDIGEGVVFYHPAFLIGVNQKNFPDDFNVFWPADFGADFASQTVAANEDFLKSDPAAVACFIRASIRGWQEAFKDPAAAVADTMTFIPEGSIPEAHQQGAIHSVLPIVGSGADDATLLALTPDNYQKTVDKLIELGYLEGEVDVAATYDAGPYNAATGAAQ